MPRRSRRPERALAVAGLVALAGTARAEVSGGVDARPLLGTDRRFGGALLADVWGLEGRLRVGGAFGLGAASGSDDASSRVFTPLALSLAVRPPDDRSGFLGVLRLGGYVGGEKGGFIGGGFGSCALGYAYALGEGASVRLTADAWGLLGVRGGLFVGPALGLGF